MHAHSTPSFHVSPQEALKAPAEEFLYLACLHEGTGVESPDFLAVVDADTGKIVHELPMPNVGDELHHYGYSHDQKRLLVPGLFSNRIHVFEIKGNEELILDDEGTKSDRCCIFPHNRSPNAECVTCPR